MTGGKAPAQRQGALYQVASRHPAHRARWGQTLGRALLLVSLSLGACIVSAAGCGSSATAVRKPSLGALFSPPAGESKAERQAFKKAVDKDPFPRAKSRAWEPEA